MENGEWKSLGCAALRWLLRSCVVFCSSVFSISDEDESIEYYDTGLMVQDTRPSLAFLSLLLLFKMETIPQESIPLGIGD